MIYLKVPVLNSIENAGGLKMTAFRIRTSIFDCTPEASFKFMSQLTPDILKVVLGSFLNVKYSFEDTINEENEEATWSTFPSVALKNIKMNGSQGGLEYLCVCKGELEFFQKSCLRKCYRDKYSDEILKDIFNNFPLFNDYEKKFEKSSTTTTLYRTLGESDLEFIKNQVCESFLIKSGKPLFFTGLDNSLNLSSANAFIESSEKAKAAIYLSTVSWSESDKFIQNKIKSSADDDYMEFHSPEFKIDLGTGNSFSGLKPSTYYTPFDTNAMIAEAFDFLPIKEKESLFPVSKMFIDQIETTDAKLFFNRPKGNLLAETKNTFNSFEDLIKIHIKLTDMGPMKSLLLAGQKVCIITPFPFSALNGDYVISAIAYGSEGPAPFCEIDAIRPNLDWSWVEGMKDLKKSEDWPFKYAPEPPKSILFSC